MSDGPSGGPLATAVAWFAARRGREARPAVKRYIAKRVGYALISLVILSLIIFLLVRLTGDPTVLLVEPGASQADLDAMRKQFGLDEPIWVQYGQFVWSLVRGDLGNSFYYRMPVLDLYVSRLPSSLMLAAADAPASPLPTTMTVYFRLLAGFTSFISNW